MAHQFTNANIELVVGIESWASSSGVPSPIEQVQVRAGSKARETAVRHHQPATRYMGTDSLEMHRDAVSANQRVLIVDDLSRRAARRTLPCRWSSSSVGSIIGIAFLIELEALKGRSLKARTPRRPRALERP